MKIFKQHFFLLLLIAITGPAVAGRIFSKPGTTEEKVFLFTDRSIYVAGEQIHFSATLFNTAGSADSLQSRILYCEIVTPEGNSVASKKYRIDHDLTDGCITIPEEQITGIYYLRAYTRQMRKSGPLSYGYKQLKVINPYRNDVLGSNNNHSLSVVESTQTEVPESNKLLSVFTDKAVYSPRDTINIYYQQPNGKTNPIRSLCLTVAPANSISSALSIPSIKESLAAETIYYPETRGLSLVGKLTEASSLTPIPDKKINLSIIGEGRDFMASRTDSLGRFFFALPDYTGSRDIFLCAEKIPAMAVKIWVDNDFCSAPYHLPAPPFSLTEPERLTALNVAQNIQIDSHFKSVVIENLIPQKEVNSFYGKPTTILYLDKYIQLPTLEEYFNELPSQVKVRKRKGESYFVVQGSTDLSFYDPLVLVDWVAVDEPSKIMAVSPQNISHIEVVNEDYVKGGQTYGGIISIISKKGNFAGIDLPATGIFVNYRFLAENKCVEKADYATNKPDTRNTILWKPEVMAPGNKIEKFVLKAPDTPGKYKVVFEGVSKDGETFSASSEFEVK